MMATIGLIDVDGSNFPNIALMKISTFHKTQGDNVLTLNTLGKTDAIYASKIFTFSKDIMKFIDHPNKMLGGTGYDIVGKLPEEIDSITKLDYTLYPQHLYSVQFFSRGCIRHCPFCLVHKKEGRIHPVEPMELNPNGKHIEVLDNNFFANPEWRSAVDWLLKAKQPINLHGVDVRIMDEEQAFYLNQLRIKGSIHIAWDNPKDNIMPHVKDMIKYIKPYKIICYVLIGFNSTIEEDLMRVMKLKEVGVMPFVQPYRDYNNERIPTQYEKDFAGWVNKRQRFKSFKFKDFMPRKGFKCESYLKNTK